MQDGQTQPLKFNLISKAKYPIIENQSGSITIFNLLILLIITILCMGVLINKVQTIKKSNQLAKNYLCMKELTGELKQHKIVLQKANNIIHLANIGQVVGLITNPSVTMTAKKIKKASQSAQKIYHFSFLNNLALLFKRGCIFSPSSTKTNFQTKVITNLQRNSLGLVKRRQNKWSIYSIGKQNILKTNFSKDQVSVEESLRIQAAKGMSNFVLRLL